MDKSVSSLFGDAVGEESDQVERFAKFGLDTPDIDAQPEDMSDADVAQSCQPRELRESHAGENTPKCGADPPHHEDVMQSEPTSSHVDSLIRQCVHAAGAMLKDPENLKYRKTERVQLLLQLLKQKTPGDRGMFAWNMVIVFRELTSYMDTNTLNPRCNVCTGFQLASTVGLCSYCALNNLASDELAGIITSTVLYNLLHCQNFGCNWFHRSLFRSYSGRTAKSLQVFKHFITHFFK